jgi:hypothetical protein
MGSTRRIVAAFPDAVTAAVFALLWVAPLAFGASGVRNAMLVMLVEFVLVHASGFMGVIMLSDRTSRGMRVAALLGFAVFYLLFIGTFVAVFAQWWPLFAFAWLLLGKLAVVLGAHRLDVGERQRVQSTWALSVLFYLGGVFATTLLPLPRLGVQPDVLPLLGLTGSGVWVDAPHCVLAFGCVYFGLGAWSKWRDWAGAQWMATRRTG